MGEVLRGHDDRLDRPVALKRILQDVREPDKALRRFRREARAAARLSHPSIVQVHDWEKSDGQHWLVMELVEGRSLAEVIADGPLAPERVLEITRDIASGLAEAHAASLVHRDLKASNVLIETKGRAKILDFGLAKTVRREAGTSASEVDGKAPSSSLTEEGRIVGTVTAMSPEQALGRKVDHRSDLFALGLLLYEMSSGISPFEGESPLETLTRICNEREEPLHRLDPKTPEGISRLASHLLEKDPALRPRNARMVVEEIDRLSSAWGQPVPSKPPDEVGEGTTLVDLDDSGLLQEPPRPEAPSRSSRPDAGSLRRRSLYVSAALAFLLGGIILDRSLSKRADTAMPTEALAPAIAVLPFENLGSAAHSHFTAGISAEITARLTEVSGLSVISYSSARRYSGSNAPISQIAAELGVDYLLEGSVRWNESEDIVSRVRITPQLTRISDRLEVLWSESYERVLDDIFAVQTEIAAQVIGRLHVAFDPGAETQQPTENMEAYQAFLRAREEVFRSDTPPTLFDAVRHCRRALELDPEFAEAWGLLAWSHAKLYNFGHDRTEQRGKMAIEAISRAKELKSTSIDIALYDAFITYWIEEDYARANEQFRDISNRRPSNSEAVKAQGYILRRMGRFEEGLERLEKALRLDPLDGQAHREVANTLTLLRRYEEAFGFYQRAIELTSDPILSYLFKIRAHWLAGDLAGARSTLEAMPETSDSLVPWYAVHQELYENNAERALQLLAGADFPPFFRATFYHWPRVLLEATILEQIGGSGARARELYAAALEAIDQELAVNPDDARLVSARGLALAGLGQHAAALAEAKRSVRMLPPGRDAVLAPGRLRDLAAIQVAAGDHAAAVATLEQVLSEPGFFSVQLLLIDPGWRPLYARDDFKRLVVRHR